MDVSTIIHRSLLTLSALAQRAGLSPSYVKHLAKTTNPRPAGPRARVQIAHALRAHARQLLSDADALDPPTPAPKRKRPPPHRTP